MNLRPILVFSAAILLVVSVLLVREHMALHYGVLFEKLYCSSEAFGGMFDCEAVALSSYSELFGIPVSAYGLGMAFWLLGLAVIMTAYPWDETAPRFAMISAWVGVIVSFIYLNISLRLVKHLCPLCMAYDVAIVIYLLCMLWISRRGRTPAVISASEPLSAPLISTSPAAAKKRIGIVAVLSLFVFALVPILIAVKSRASAKEGEKSLEELRAQWSTKEKTALPQDDFDPILGVASTPVEVVVFSDFECPYCAAAALQFDRLLIKHPDKVHVRFKHFPLNALCNPAVQMGMHKHACVRALAAQCAQAQGKFQSYHDKLFAHQKEDLDDTKFREWAKADGMNVEEFAACMKSDDFQGKIRLHAREGESLKIHGTPTIYINGRHFEGMPTVFNLEQIIAIESR